MKPSLEPELVWQDDGHLSDEALVAAADAQDVLPEGALLHLDECDDCTTRLGEQVLLSADVHEALGALAPAPAAAPARVPAIAVAAGLVLAALGAVPLFLDLPGLIATLRLIAMQGLPAALRGARTLLHAAVSGSSEAWVFGWSAAAIVLLAAGLIIARVAPREMDWKGARG